MKTLSLLLSFFLALSQVSAQTLIRWDFEVDGQATLSSTYIEDTTRLIVNPVTFSDLIPLQGMSVFISGVSGQQSDKAVNVRDWSVSEGDGSWLNDWIELRFFVDTGVIGAVDSVSFWYKKNILGPKKLDFRSHKDNYITPLDSVILLESDISWHKWTILPDSFSVNGFEQVTFRIYGTDAISSTLGTLALDSVAIYGEVFPGLTVPVRAFLSGPWNGADMHDSLRHKGLVPLTDPYGFNRAVTPQILDMPGSEAIVDWVVVQLRDSVDPGIVSAENAFLLQRDGDIVDIDGVSVPRFYVDTAAYYVGVFHRNHLGAVTGSTVDLSDTIDFTSGGMPVLGLEPLRPLGSYWGLWDGDVNGDNLIKYTGTNNDRDIILLGIGGFLPTNVESGYFDSDVNMDGLVKYTGSLNDRDPVLLSIGGVLPTNVRSGQVP